VSGVTPSSSMPTNAVYLRGDVPGSLAGVPEHLASVPNRGDPKPQRSRVSAGHQKGCSHMPEARVWEEPSQEPRNTIGKNPAHRPDPSGPAVGHNRVSGCCLTCLDQALGPLGRWRSQQQAAAGRWYSRVRAVVSYDTKTTPLIGAIECLHFRSMLGAELLGVGREATSRCIRSRSGTQLSFRRFAEVRRHASLNLGRGDCHEADWACAPRGARINHPTWPAEHYCSHPGLDPFCLGALSSASFCSTAARHVRGASTRSHCVWQ
jgi:hypothetical protein